MKDYTHQVCVYQFHIKEPVKVLKAINENEANKIDRSLNVNLNHDNFYTLIEPIKKDEK